MILYWHPIDVVKTRLQVKLGKAKTHYSGLRDAFVKICEQYTRPYETTYY